MAIYTGIDGVVRSLKGVVEGDSGMVSEVPVMKCGIEGVVRNLLSFTDNIDHVEVSDFHVYVDTLNYDGEYVSTDGEDLATLKRYGSISFGTNSVQVTCSTVRKRIYITYFIYIVYKDGSIVYLDDIFGAGASYALTVTGYEYFNTDGWYHNCCLGSEVVTGHVSSSSTNTVVFRDVQLQTGGYLSAAVKSSGNNQSKQTFNSIRINGQNIPITVVNNLT